MLIKQGFTLVDDIIVVFLVEIDLSHVVLRLVAQFGVTGNVAELLLCHVIVAPCILQISLIELAGTAITLATFQFIILAFSVVVVTQAQVTVGAAILQVLVTVEVKRAVAHERIAQQRTLPLPTVEVIVTYLQLGLG